MHARGIRDAFRDLELLVEAADTSLSGRAPFAEAMAHYEETRNAAALPIYRRLCTELQFPSLSDAEMRLLMAVGEDQNLADRFLGMRAGTVTRAEFRAAAPAPISRLLDAAEP